jgi:hypothetical protein
MPAAVEFVIASVLRVPRWPDFRDEHAKLGENR